MNTWNPTKNNESGLVDITFIMIMIVVVIGLLAQIILNQKSLNTGHRDAKDRLIVNQRLLALALRFKEVRNQAQVLASCPPGTSKLMKNGAEFCLPSGDSMCIRITDVIGGREEEYRVCTSIRDEDLEWNNSFSGSESIADNDSVHGASGVQTRIRVPALTDSLWQSCDPSVPSNVCLRVLLCNDSDRDGHTDTNCTIDNAKAYQVIKF